jgi:prephenate dehydratase
VSRRIAYLGPPGTFSEEAALAYCPDAELVPVSTIPGALDAVVRGEADEAIVPVENSLQGSVTETVDALIETPEVAIRGELILRVVQCLLARPGTRLEDIRVVYSLPQPLGQCRKFLETRLPHAATAAALSTAAAVELMMREGPGAAAIGTRRAAALYGAAILAEDIADYPNNKTRFAIVGREDHPPTGNDKTSIAFSVAHDRPGSLVDVLHEFSDRAINLTKIESRPSKQELGIYIFLIDFEGHRTEPAVAEALEAVRRKAFFFRVFGSYPAFREPRG